MRSGSRGYEPVLGRHRRPPRHGRRRRPRHRRRRGPMAQPRPDGPRLRAGSPVLQQGDGAGGTGGRRARLRALWRTRMEPGVATGLALTLAVTALVVLTATVGILLVMVRTKTGVARYDLTLAEWGAT